MDRPRHYIGFFDRAFVVTGVTGLILWYRAAKLLGGRSAQDRVEP
jgi:hypothetical protein